MEEAEGDLEDDDPAGLQSRAPSPASPVASIGYLLDSDPEDFSEGEAEIDEVYQYPYD